MYLKSLKTNRRITTCNRLDLEALGSWAIISLDTGACKANISFIKTVLMYKEKNGDLQSKEKNLW